MKKATFFTVGIILSFIAGYITHAKASKPKIVKETKTVSKIVYRDYNKTDLVTELMKYDQGEFSITGKMRGNWIDIRSSLSQRTATKSFRISVGSDTHFKYYIGVGAVILAIGYGVGKL